MKALKECDYLHLYTWKNNIYCCNHTESNLLSTKTPTETQSKCLFVQRQVQDQFFEGYSSVIIQGIGSVSIFVKVKWKQNLWLAMILLCCLGWYCTAS